MPRTLLLLLVFSASTLLAAAQAGAPQTIRHFEEHIYPELNAAPAEPMPAMAPGVFTNFSPAPPASSLNVLLLDTLNTPLKDQAFVATS
jgi:hypothetical protein